jgi:hypothetical protein
MDDLVSEPSSRVSLHALRMAKDQGLRVVVTGEANDELCCGHGGMITSVTATIVAGSRTCSGRSGCAA